MSDERNTPDDGGMSEFWDAVREDRRSRHAQNKTSNTQIIVSSGLTYQSKNHGENLLFRNPGKPKVDFFPSTGRWREVTQNKNYSGGAEAFLSWYRKQKL